MTTETLPLIFEQTKAGRISYSLPPLDVPTVDITSILGEENIRQTPAELPELAELDLIRH